MKSHYKQPPLWPVNVDYTGYLYSIVTGENLLQYKRIRKRIIERIPKLGEKGADELILKLSSYLRDII